MSLYNLTTDVTFELENCTLTSYELYDDYNDIIYNAIEDNIESIYKKSWPNISRYMILKNIEIDDDYSTTNGFDSTYFFTITATYVLKFKNNTRRNMLKLMYPTELSNTKIDV